MVPQTLVENIVVIAVEVIGVLFFGLLISSIRSVACLCSCWIRHSLLGFTRSCSCCLWPCCATDSRAGQADTNGPAAAARGDTAQP